MRAVFWVVTNQAKIYPPNFHPLVPATKSAARETLPWEKSPPGLFWHNSAVHPFSLLCRQWLMSWWCDHDVPQSSTADPISGPQAKRVTSQWDARQTVAEKVAWVVGVRRYWAAQDSSHFPKCRSSWNFIIGCQRQWPATAKLWVTNLGHPKNPTPGSSSKPKTCIWCTPPQQQGLQEGHALCPFPSRKGGIGNWAMIHWMCPVMVAAANGIKVTLPHL